MTFALTYAGVPLAVPTAEVLRWVAAELPSQALAFPAPAGWPSSALAGLDAFALPQRRHGRIGSLYWPAGASRFAVGYFLATTKQVAAVRQGLPAGAAAPFVLDTGDADGSLFADLFLLPPRPLTSLGPPDPAVEDLYLLTLVDERFYWWSRVGDDTLAVADDATTWDSLVTVAATLLGVTITADPVDDADWGFAPNGLDLSGVPVPVALDALCYAAGLRISRQLDGTVLAANTDTDGATIRENLEFEGRRWPALSGGPFRLDSDPDNPEQADPADDQSLILPETVNLVTLADAGPATDAVDLITQDPDLFQFVRVGRERTWTTRRRDGYDAAAQTTYAETFARSFGVRTLAAVARRFAGIVAWVPEGVSEAVEWVYVESEAVTVVHPPPWHDGVLEILGIPPAASSSAAAAMLRVTGRPTNVAGVRHYPTLVQAKLGDPPVFADTTTAAWLVQESGEVLGTTGTFKAMSLRDGAGTVGGVARPRYRTDREIVMKDAACVAGVLQGTYNGTYEGDLAATPALDYSLPENSMYDLLHFGG